MSTVSGAPPTDRINLNLTDTQKKERQEAISAWGQFGTLIGGNAKVQQDIQLMNTAKTPEDQQKARTSFLADMSPEEKQKFDAAQKEQSDWMNCLSDQQKKDDAANQKPSGPGGETGGTTELSTHAPGSANADPKGYSDDLKAHAQKHADKDGNLSADGLGQALGGVKLDDKSMKYFDLDGDGKVNVKEAAVAERYADGSNTKREDGSGAEALDGKISSDERDALQKQIDLSGSAQNQDDQVKQWHGSTMLGAGVG